MEPKAAPLDFYAIAVTVDHPAAGPALRERSMDVPLTEIDDPIVQLHMRRMADITARDPNCLGIAAPQMGIPLRIFTLKRQGGGVLCCVNPTVEPVRSALRACEWEGCFSIPGKRSYVERATAVQLTYLTEAGELGSVKLAGLEARVAQHEVDHLDGVLIDCHGPLRPVVGDVISTGFTLGENERDTESVGQMVRHG